MAAQRPRQKVETSVYLSYELLREVDRHCKQIERSRSWMFEKVMREKLGLLDEEEQVDVGTP